MYDELTIGYKDVRTVFPYPSDGGFERAVHVDGETLGSWRRTRSARAAELQVRWFGPPADISAVVARLERFWGVPVSVRSG